MGIIDSYSDHSLYDIVNGDLGMSDQGRGYREPEGSVEFAGIHIYPHNDSGEYTLQYDGYVGQMDTIDAADYDDVLELVDDLMTHVFEIEHLHHNGDKSDLVEYVGKQMTSDEDKANANPELYVHIPDDV